MAAQCACCGKPLPFPEPSDPDVLLWHTKCLELRSAGARYARELEDGDLADYAAAYRAYPDQAVEVRAR